MALNSSNSNAGSTEPKIGAGALSNFNTQNTENKSNGNFSGGDINFDTSKLGIHDPLNPNKPQQPTFGVDSVFNPKLSGNLDIDFSNTNNNNSSNNTTYSNNSPEPTMTVDEVYGKSNNQPVVEKQGDYATSSNEKSNVETSTFGKQDEISVTPTSVTENKGMVENATIQSVEGLDFQQKDKASQEVLDSKKKRDEVEAEDKADNMRNKLKGDIDKAAQEEGGEDFRIGTSEAEKKFNEEKARRQAELNKKKQAVVDAEKKYNESKDTSKWIDENLKRLKNQYEIDLRTADQELSIIKNMQKNADEMNSQGYLAKKLNERSDSYKTMKQKVIEYASEQGFGDVEINSTEDLVNFVNTLYNIAIKSRDNIVSDYKDNGERMEKQKVKADTDSIINKGILDEAKEEANKLEKDYNAWKKAEEEKLKAGATPESQPETPQSGAETSYNDAMNAIKNSENATPEQKAQAEEVLTNLEESRKALEEAAAKARSGDQADMVAYQEALETYNKNLKEAQKIGNRWTQTDFNKDYTRAVAQANDFKVTLADGTEMEYSDFATEEATKSPQYANAMYEKKAADYEKNGHPILAKIERWKAEWSQTWLGSKLTFADNKVRDQFNQMAKTDMRATYAAYNNVLNDETGKYSEADKAEASKAINQAKALMTASAALQASTGFLSGIGDSMEDGISGTTDPGALNAWQKTLNTVDNIIRITLGLGISPAANKAYQNMYYMAGDKVNNSLLFNKDFDSDGFVLCQEYGNNAATGMIAGAGELAVGIAMMFNPASMSSGLNLITDSVQTFLNGLYGVRNEAEKSQKYTQEVLEYFKEAEDIAESSGNEEAVQEITNAITQIENFELKSDEVGNIDNWLEGSGSNTESNEKFNQSLTYDEWLKLIEADPTMREFAKSLTEKKKDKNAQKDNADTGVNS